VTARPRPRTILVVSPDADVAVIAAEHKRFAGSIAELRAVLDAAPAAAPAAPDDPPGSLDLIGHGTRGHNYLRLGDEPIDLLVPAVARAFRAIAEDGVLARLGIGRVRLLGCSTAVGDASRRSLVALERILGVPVFGSSKALSVHHYDARGLRPAFESLLVAARSIA
jgi:hypothetical protein